MIGIGCFLLIFYSEGCATILVDVCNIDQRTSEQNICMVLQWNVAQRNVMKMDAYVLNTDVLLMIVWTST